MKKIVATLIASALLTGTAFAYPQAAPSHHSQSQQSQQAKPQTKKTPQPAKAKPHQATKKAATSSRYPTPPKHWGKRSTNEWRSHVDKCSKKYRSYNAKTDSFKLHSGKTSICRL